MLEDESRGLVAGRGQPELDLRGGTLVLAEQNQSLLEGWIVWSIALYLVTGAFWLPVVWMQMRMRDLAVRASGPTATAAFTRPVALTR